MSSKQTIETLEPYLSNKVPINSSRLKKHLFNLDLKKRKCEICKLKTWNESKIPLELHHVDGNNKNNHIFNLQILCPNCHAQTENFRGSNKKIRKLVKSVPETVLIEAVKTSYNRREALIKCGLSAYGGTYERIDRVIEKHKLCFLVKEKTKRIRVYIPKERSIKEKSPKPPKIPRINLTKIAWPSDKDLIDMVKSKSVSSIAKNLGVSDNAIRGRLKRRGIDITGISQWSQKHGDCSSKWRK